MIRLNANAGIPLRYVNRHGLITGATGTGKTVTLQRLTEEMSRAGVPCFVADVKGDIAALSRSCPADLLDLFGMSGRPIRVTFRAMGADLIARALELSDAQAGVVEVSFAYARDHGLPLETLSDFRALLARVHANSKAISAHYGQAGAASIGVVQRALMRLEAQAGRAFFASPSFDVADMLQPGKVSILAADRLLRAPRLYGAFLLWMLSDLYDRLPEVGDVDKPRLVFFFDESHLLFQDCPPALLRRIEQTVRLIRSKGVGVYFVSQSPDDVPPLIREQLAHRVEHDRSLPVGVARVRTMTPDGKPAPLQTVRIDPPACPLGSLTTAEAARFAPMPATSRQASRKRLPILPACLVALPLLALSAAWIYSAGYAGHAIGAVLALTLFVRRRVKLT